MRTQSSVLSFVGVIAIGFATFIVSSGGATAAPAPPPGVGVSTIRSSYAGDLEWWLAKSSPDDFGGVKLDEAAGRLRVFARGGTSRADQLAGEIKALAAWELTAVVDEAGRPVEDSSPLLTVDLVPAVKTFSQLNEVAVKVAGVDLRGRPGAGKDIDWAKQVGDRLASVQPDYSTGQLEVGVASLADADKNTARSKFGADVNVVSREKGAKTARMNDNSPHFGGANIGDGNGDCSTAFTTVNSSGQRKLLTAGHCGPAGVAWFSSINNYSFGTMQGSTNCYGCRDEGYLGGSTYNPYVYMGTSAYYNGAWNPPDWDNSGASAVVKGMSTSSSLVGLIFSGSRTGQSGGHQIPVNNALLCVALGTDYNCGVRYTTRSGGSYAKAGDSGGAVVVYESSQLKAVGIEFGVSTYNLYYSPIGPVLSDFGLSLVTG
jgi:hypothetical protein